MEVAILLHNVRSAYNVGSIFRTAEAAGVKRIYMSGYTPAPIDRFGRESKLLSKTALGAEHFVTWKKVSTPAACFQRLRRSGWSIIGVEQDTRAKQYAKFKAHKPTLFVFGNEVRGLSKSVRDQCDGLIEIPMHGKKESLNVAVAAGIILFSCRT